MRLMNLKILIPVSHILLFIYGRFSTGILLKSHPRKMSKAVYLYEPQI